MRKKLYRWLTYPFVGKLPSIVFVKRSAWPGTKVTLVDREEFEYMIKGMERQWLRGFLIGIALVVSVGAVSFILGVKVAWVEEKNYFMEACTRVVNEACQRPMPQLTDRSPFKVYCSRPMFSAAPVYEVKRK